MDGLPKNVGSDRRQSVQLTAYSNVFVERLWKSVKYEEVYLKAYDSVSNAKAHLGTYLNFFNTRRPHQSLDGKTPDTIYYAGLPHENIAA